MDEIINNYRARKVENKYFITLDSGKHISVNEENFNSLKNEIVSPSLSKKFQEIGLILNDANLDKVVSDTRKRNDFIFFGPSLHIIIPTLRCNMQCIYCHASSVKEDDNSYEMDKKTIKKMIDFIFNSPNPNVKIEIQGGEPLLNWEGVKQIIDYSKEKNNVLNKNLNVSIVTNFTLMDNEKMDYLINNDVGICTSLDGPKELHDSNRVFLGNSSYDLVIDWIKNFNKEYEKRGIQKSVNALPTITKKSLDYSKEIVDEYAKLGLKSLHIRFLNELGTAKKTWAKINYSSKEFIGFWNKSIDYIKSLQKEGVDINERMYEIIFSKISGDHDPGYLDLRTPCGAVIGQLAYNYNGNIYTCDEARMVGEDLFQIGNVNQKYEDVVTSDKSCKIINSSINDQYMCNDCAYKPYCGVCPVCNYSEQGNIIAKISETSRCKIFMAQFDRVVRENFINE